jgi:hypothetical protein
MSENFYDKPEIEQVAGSIAAMMDGDCWAGPSPYEAEILEGNVVITCKDTGNRYRVYVVKISDKDVEVKKKSSGLWSPCTGVKG